MRIDIYFTAAKMVPYVGVKYSEKVEADGIQVVHKVSSRHEKNYV